MVDDHACQQPSLWGLFRDDGSARPVATALGTAIHAFADYTRARFVPLARRTLRWAAWPDNPAAYAPNWRVYQVVLDRPGNTRVIVLWNGDAARAQVRLPRGGAVSASTLDLSSGAERALTADRSGDWQVDLPGATATFRVNQTMRDPDGYHYIGGTPVLVVERGVDPAAAVPPPTVL